MTRGVAQNSSRLILGLGLAGFLLFGMRDGALGVAWPSIRSGFAQPLSALGLLVLIGLAGYLVGSTASGRLATRLTAGHQLVLASSAAALGLAAYAFATQWLFLLAATCLIGLANGVVDVNVNAYIALNHRAGTMNLVHAGWGVGSTLGPIVVTASLAFNGSWRPAYAVLVGFELALLTGFVATRDLWSAAVTGRARSDAGGAVPAPPVARLHLPATLALFSTYAGLEQAAGLWAYSFLVSGHGISTALAGIAVASYWAALTGGRIIGSVVGNHVRAAFLIDASLAVAAGGCLLVFWYPSAPAAGCGLAVLGIGLGPVFPTLASMTPARVGAARTARVMGYQLSAGALGGAVLTALVGVVLQQTGPGTLGAVLLIGIGIVVLVRGALQPWRRA